MTLRQGRACSHRYIPGALGLAGGAQLGHKGWAIRPCLEPGNIQLTNLKIRAFDSGVVKTVWNAGGGGVKRPGQPIAPAGRLVS